ncbi:OmpH family outer membrane protein [Pararhodospirillum photometricum]|uniref:Outer membrane chaperone Skp (OmpH) n=1 Tax=Pararhodospirillum photometricum DSM 122 TaxID=1150469 RepID=H6SM97_PARPM|nr:OmpH family outer membrane protein [Pararhodospirillum photometricum]CCG06780.1 Outer membrane chaperone Skp (OmpH) [Pararhodospirillum photometricum DSM 122]
MGSLKGARRLACAALLFVSLPMGAALAEDFPNSTVGVIDVQKILADSAAAKQARAERDKYLATYQAQAQKEEKALHDAQAALARETDQGSESFKKKRQDFEKKVGAFQVRFTTLRQNLDRAMAQSLGEIQDMVIRVSDQVASERSVNLVLYKTQVLLFDPRMNMTDEVLKRVDTNLPKVTFPNPEQLPAPSQDGK